MEEKNVKVEEKTSTKKPKAKATSKTKKVAKAKAPTKVEKTETTKPVVAKVEKETKKEPETKTPQSLVATDIISKTENKIKQRLQEFDEDSIDPVLIAKFKNTPSWEKIVKLEKIKFKKWVLKEEAEALYDLGIETDKLFMDDHKYKFVTRVKKTYAFRMHSLTLLAVFLFAAIVLTWFVRGGSLDNSNNWSYVQGDFARLGVFDFFKYVGEGFISKAGIILLLMSISAYTGILIRTKSLQAFCDHLYYKFGNRRGLLVFMLIIVAFISSSVYSSIILLALTPIIIPFVIALGYTLSVGFFIVLVGIGVGMMASTFNVAVSGEAINAINSVMSDGNTYLISVLDGIWIKYALLVILLYFASYMMLRYERRIAGDIRPYHFKEENDAYISSKSMVYSIKEATEFTTRRKLIMFTFPVMLIIIMLASINWESMGVNQLVHFSNWIRSNGIASFIYGDTNDLGKWGYFDVSIIILFFTFIIAMIAKQNQFKIFEGISRGINAMTTIALFIVGAGAISAVFEKTGMHYTLLYKPLTSNVSEVFTLFVTFITSAITFITIPFEADVSRIIAETVAPTAILQNTSLAYQSLVSASIAVGIGSAFMLAPTSPIVFGVLIFGNVSYTKWVKSIYVQVLSLALIAMTTITVIALIVL